MRPDRFELPTFWFVARRSIQLSYGRDTPDTTNLAGLATDRKSCGLSCDRNPAVPQPEGWGATIRISGAAWRIAVLWL